MPQPKVWLRNPIVKEVSLVGAGDNRPARILIYKAEPETQSLAERFRSALDAVRKALGREPSREVRKQLYDDVRQRQDARQVYDALMLRMNALSSSLESIIWYPSDEEKARPLEDLVRETVQQFASSIEKDAASLLAGRIAKRLAKMREDEPAPLPISELEAVLLAEFEMLKGAGAPPEPEPTGPGEGRKLEDEPVKKEFPAILAALGEEDRKTVEAHLAAEIAKAKPADPAGAGSSTPDPDPLAALPVALRKQLDEERAANAASRAENLALKQRMEKMEKSAARAEFRKSVEFRNLSAPTDELVDALIELPEATRSLIVKTLGAANEIAGKGGAFTAIGTDQGSPGTAQHEIQSRAVELQKSDPKLTIEQARSAVLKADPDLYARLDLEAQARRQGAH